MLIYPPLFIGGKMRTLAIDIETFSSVNLLNSGVYAYTEDEDFEILLFAYAFDDDEVKIVDFTKGEKLSQELVDALKDEKITDKSMLTVGDYGKVSMTFYPYNASDGQGVAILLGNIQFLRKGVPIYDKVSAIDEFEVVQEVDEDFLD